jgi:hypothetical protein
MQKLIKKHSDSRIQWFPLAYVSLSLSVLMLAILSQFRLQRAQTFPLFPELPFQRNYGFTVHSAFESKIGVAVLSFVGILVDYFIFSINQRRLLKKGCYNQKVTYHSFPPGILLSGVLSHFFFFAFALLPADQKSKTPPSMLYAEDRVFLTLSFALNFVFKSYYVFFR